MAKQKIGLRRRRNEVQLREQGQSLQSLLKPEQVCRALGAPLAQIERAGAHNDSQDFCWSYRRC